MVVDVPDVVLVTCISLRRRDADLSFPEIDVSKPYICLFDRSNADLVQQSYHQLVANGRRVGMLEYLPNVLGRDGHDGVVRIATLLEHLDLLLVRNQGKTEQSSVESPLQNGLPGGYPVVLMSRQMFG